MLYHVELVGAGNQGKTVVVRANHHTDAIEAASRANPGFTYTGRFATQPDPEGQPQVIDGDEGDGEGE